MRILLAISGILVPVSGGRLLAPLTGWALERASAGVVWCGTKEWGYAESAGTTCARTSSYRACASSCHHVRCNVAGTGRGGEHRNTSRLLSAGSRPGNTPSQYREEERDEQEQSRCRPPSLMALARVVATTTKRRHRSNSRLPQRAAPGGYIRSSSGHRRPASGQ